MRIARTTAALIATGAAVSALAGGMPENAIVVVNADSWASTRIANEYIRLRQIPPANVIYLGGLKEFELTDVETFRQQILLPVLKTIEERGLAGQVDYVLYSSDFPTGIHVAGDAGNRRLPKLLTPNASINSLTFLYQFTLAKDIRYLDLNSNRYARRVGTHSSDSLWTPDEQHRYAEATQKLAEARGSRDALRALIETMRDLSRAHPHSAELLYNLACALAVIGEASEAIAALEKAVAAGWWNHQHALRDKDLASLRERADFKVLLERMRHTPLELQPTVGFRNSTAWTAGGPGGSAGNGHRYLLSTMLACTSGRGNSVREALAGLRRSVAADGTRPAGTLYFMQNGDLRSTTREWAFRAAVSGLKQLGVHAVIEPGVLPQNKRDVAGALIGAAQFEWAKCGSTILPGAICEHLTSTGGAMRETGGQTPLSELLRHGAAGASGTVSEPFAIQAKFPSAFLHLHYARGATLAEAFYESVTGPYQLLIVGDALCKPWAAKVEVEADGLRPGGVLKGLVAVTPRATCAGRAKLARSALHLDGRRVAEVEAGQTIEFDSRQIPDGAHEMQVICTCDDAIRTQGRLAVPVIVANTAARLEAAGPARGAVPWDRKIELRARLAGAKEVVFLHNNRPVARIGGSGGGVRLDPRTLGQGPVRLVPVGVLKDKQSSRVYGRPLDFEVVPPPALPAVEPPAENERVPGFAVTAGGKAPVVMENLLPDPIAAAGVVAGVTFAIESFFSVPDDDVYQFQVRGHENIRALLVDGQSQDWPRGKTWWFLPVHLAKGWHRLRIEGRVAERPHMDLRFGGIGTRELNVKRSAIWFCKPAR